MPKPSTQQIILSATFALLLTNIAQAATEFTDGTANPSTSSSDSSSATTSSIGPLDPTTPPKPATPTAPLKEAFDPNAPLIPAQPSVLVKEPFDPNAPPRTTIPIGPNLTFGGYIELNAESDRGYSLNTKTNDATSIFTPKLSPAFSYDPNRYLQIYANPTVETPVAFEETIDNTQTPAVKLNLAFLTLKNIVDGVRLQVGRQRFIDTKRWLFNESMDAARLAYQYENISLELSASRFSLFQTDLLNRERKDIGETSINYYSYLDYKFGPKNHVGVFALYQDEQLLNQKHPIFVGLQSEGRIVKHLKYWLQTAIVRGTDGSRHIRGEAIDVGLTQVFGGALEPSITVGYAYGTGDSNPNDNVDTSFRQTGFQGNSDKFNGVARFKYYGEVLDPRLTNLMIFTGGVGIRPGEKTSFDLVYHYYLQDHASTSIRGSDLTTDPTGLSKYVGNEVDLVAGYQEIAALQTKFVLGYFMPGRAFTDTSRDGAFLASILFRYNFY
jgi:alginate production protein